MKKYNGRWDKIRKIQTESSSAYHVLGGLALVGFGIWIGAHLFAGDAGFGSNIYAEFIGIVTTFFVIDYLNRMREARRRELEIRDRLLREARSPQASIAQEAFYEMWASKLVFGEDSILREANLHRASPGKVTLANARMEKAFMWDTSFQYSTFTGAVLDYADLKGAELDNVSLRDASLRNANLEGASLTHADLICATLEGANLLNANLEHVHHYIHWLGDPETDRFNPGSPKQLILPDGSFATENFDFSRFTDESRKDFWRSPDPESPAYRGHYQRRLDMIRRFTENRPPPPPTPPPAAGDPT